MKKQNYSLIRFLVILGAISLACGVSINMSETPTAAPPPAQLQPQPVAPVPSIPPRPTLDVPPQPTGAIPPTQNTVNQPTVGPQPSNSEVPADFQKLVERYYNKGYLSSKEGAYHHLEDFSMDSADRQVLFTKRETGYDVQDFMVKAHFKWKSAIVNPDPGGCGWAFRGTRDHTYFTFVDREWIFLGMFVSNQWTRYGKTSGNDWVGLGNPAEADVVLTVSKGKAYYIINDTFASSYTLDTDSLTGAGELDYAVVAGTFKDYGTRCEMTKVDLWISNP